MRESLNEGSQGMIAAETISQQWYQKKIHFLVNKKKAKTQTKDILGRKNSRIGNSL